VPITVLPSKNVTVPVTIQQGETAAVNVTDCPTVDGLTLEVTVTVVLSTTAWVKVPEEFP
jgi:hypothetical protein